MSNNREVEIVEPTAEEMEVVRNTWNVVAHNRLPDDDRNVSPSLAFGLAFYNAMFREDPELEKLFPNIMKQARALTGMISYITKPTAGLVELRQSMRELGSRHAFYGVKMEMFTVVGQAFIIALQERLEDKYDAETGRCWLKAYIFISHNMKIGLESQLNWEEGRQSSSEAKKPKRKFCSIQ